MKLWCCYVPNLGFGDVSYLATKIRDVSNVVSGGTPDTSNPNYWDGEINWFTPSEIGNSKYVENSKRRITSLGYKNCGAKLMSPESILLSSRATVGDASISKTECCTNQGFQSLTDFKCCGQYLYYYLQTYRIHKSLIRRASGSTFLEISNYEVGNTDIFIPDLNIQEKIAIFLSKIDDRIETQNKIIEKYESLIKQLNDDIFSRGDNSKISDFIQELSKRNKEGAVTNVLSVSNKNGFVKQSEQFEDKELASEDKTNYKIVQKGDFAFNPARINVGSIALLKNQEIGIVSPMYICFKAKNIPSEILESYFSSSSFKKEMNKRLEGSVRMCLTIDGMKNIRFHNPSKKEIDILSRLTKLKELVVISKRILDLYNSQKSYLLSNLFI